MKKRLILLTLALVVIGTACKKKGCTDPEAVNYSIEAKKDDASCTYEATFSVWWGGLAYFHLSNAGVTRLYLDVNGVAIGSHPTNSYGQYAPDCGPDANKMLETTIDLGSDPTRNINYEVEL